MKTISVLGALALLLALAASANAQATCRPRFAGGYTCYDGRGGVFTAVPRFGGGYNIFDSAGNAWISTPRADGSITTYHGASPRRRQCDVRQLRQHVEDRARRLRRHHHVRYVRPPHALCADPRRQLLAGGGSGGRCVRRGCLIERRSDDR
jgi:hypothetical protein